MPLFFRSPLGSLLTIAGLFVVLGAHAADSAEFVEISQPSEQTGSSGSEVAAPEVLLALSAEAEAGPAKLATPPLTGPQLTLAESIALALAGNPQLQALEFERQAAVARKVKAGQLPNPELHFELSDFLGTAEMQMFRSAGSSLGISQLVERSCKRLLRCEVAEREGDVAQAEAERRRLDIMLAVSEAYAEAVAAQERLSLALEFETLIQQVYDLVDLRVQGGKAARLDLNRSKLELLSARLQREQYELALAGTLARLSSFWDGDPEGYAGVDGELGLPAEVPGVEQLERFLALSPDQALWDAETELRRARLRLASREAQPDYTVSGGLARFEDTDSFGLSVGISIPLRRHHKGEGQVMEAQAYLSQVESLREADLLRTRQELTQIYARLAAAHELALSIEGEVLPAARESFELTQLGYRYGKFTLLDVFDAQRILIEARRHHLEALADYQKAAVELERLLATPLSQLDASLAGTQALLEAESGPQSGSGSNTDQFNHQTQSKETEDE